VYLDTTGALRGQTGGGKLRGPGQKKKQKLLVGPEVTKPPLHEKKNYGKKNVVKADKRKGSFLRKRGVKRKKPSW